MKELDFQKLVAEELEKMGARCYSYNRGIGRGRFLPIGHRRRFDILVFHNCSTISNPFAIEAKTDGNFSAITKALQDQIKGEYIGKEFTCAAENWKGVPTLFVLLTEDAYAVGNVYTRNHAEASNFFVDRFAWRLTKGKLGVLYRDTQTGWWVSHENKFTNLFTGETLWQIKDEEGKRPSFKGCL